MILTAANAPRIRSLGRIAVAAGLALGLAVPFAFGASAREFEPGDDHGGHGAEFGDDHGNHSGFGDDHGGFVVTGPVWSTPAWPTTDDHGGWFHD